MKLNGAIVIFLTMLPLALPAQQIPDNPLVREYLKKRGLSESEARALARSYQQQADTASLKADSIGIVDSTAQAQADSLERVNAAERSFYEDMFSDRVREPDSMIKNLTMFGHDLFSGSRQPPTDQSAALATPADYVVASGDEVVVLLWGRVNEEYRLKVDREGNINIPHIGPVTVAGMRFSSMQKTILDRVQAIEGVQATVSLSELRSIGVFIVGEVRFPGLYTVASLSNITNALLVAGGPTKLGSLRHVQLKRGGSVIATIDFYDFLLAGRDNSSIQLKSGDVIVVPLVKSMIAIAGNVRKSALYEIKAGTTLADAINLAGGVTPSAWTSRIQVERYSANEYRIVLDLQSGKEQKLPAFDVQDGDIIKIFGVVEKDKNVVYLSGNVLRPGKYEFKEGMRVCDLVKGYDALQPETYLDYAIIMRREPPNYRDRIIPFNLKKAIDRSDAADNMALIAKDEVFVYPREYFEPDRVVYIDGAVNVPGKERLFENMRIRDLIVKAGGLTDVASLDQGELYRRSFINEKTSVEKVAFNVAKALADDPEANILLARYDRVYIRRKVGWEEERRVQLRGEVVFPGEYVLLKNETLDQLISRAGGFTSDAFLPAALLTRVSVKELEQRRIEEYINRLEADAVKLSTEAAARGQQTVEIQALLQQQQMLLGKLRTLETTGRVVIDLTDVRAYRGFNLEDGDVLLVPRQMGTVSVIGEVYNPATFRYGDAGLDAGHYIELAGGLKETADREHIYITKVNGGIITNKLTNVLRTSLGPGDAVVVPAQLRFTDNFKTFVDGIDATFKIVAILGSFAALLVAVNTLSN